MGRQRVEYIDLAKGFCIALVVLFHAKGIFGYNSAIDPFLSSFRLPLYFFLSGLFFKDYGSLLTFLVKKVNRLLIPFSAFYMCFSVAVPNLLYTVFGVSFETVVGWPSLWAFVWPGEYPNIPIWFLWCLFLMNMLFYLVHSSVGGKEVLLGVVSLAAGIAGEALFQVFPHDLGNVCKALQSMPFFYSGFLSSRHRGLLILDSLSRSVKLGLAAVLSLLTFVLSVLLPENLLLYYVAGLCGTLFVILLAAAFGYLPLFSYIGRYSIILLLTHGLLIRCLTPLRPILLSATNVQISIFVVTAIILLSYYLIIPLMRRYLPYVTAQKPLLRES